MRKRIVIFLLALSVILVSACGKSTSSGALYNSPQSNEIHIGIAFPVALRSGDTYLAKGIELAVETINAEGGVLGKTLKTVVRDDLNDTHVAMQIAETFNEQGITAVVGHGSTNICYFVEDIYEDNEVVMLSPTATGTNMYEHYFQYNYQYLYRMIADNRVFAEAIAEYMAGSGFSRVAIYFSDDEYGEDFSYVLEDELSERDISVIDRVTSVTSSNIGQIMDRWTAFGCDGVIMAALPPEIIEPIQLIHDADMEFPIFGADNFDRTTFISDLGRYSGALYMASYRTEDLDPVFLNAFRAKYGHGPDIHAIAAYEAVYLLKDAMDASGSVDGASIAKYLSELKDYKTVSGIHSYDAENREFDGYKVAVQKLEAK